ncbi:5929_t:CDS:2 [Dentiscutata erythropus]|uniref:5929_t:CDS:1 n=1 Tax=Dentiscutata erythropus TaxID=1348616 RepID=A0A9N9P3P4_9GLOM|nr:5929_t:CDS:2 [Dentiscutata erythropus]
MASSSSNTVSLEERQKQLNRERQKRFRNKNRETISHLFDDVFEELEYLFNTEVPIVVVESIETSAIDTDSGSDSDDLLPLPNTKVPTITNLEFINTQSNQSSRHDKTKHHDIGRINQTCRHCKAKFWITEKNQNSRIAASKFSLCCANNKVQLPPLLEPPPYLLNLYTLTNPDAVEFRNYTRANFRIHGQVYHLIGSLLPNEGHTLAFAQLYIYDTANEITNRQNAMQKLNENILQSLQNMLDICNPYIQNFWQVRNIIHNNVTTEISMIIHGDRNQDIRHYNAPTASDVAAIMVGDGYKINPTSRNILLRTRDGNL